MLQPPSLRFSQPPLTGLLATRSGGFHPALDDSHPRLGLDCGALATLWCRYAPEDTDGWSEEDVADGAKIPHGTIKGVKRIR